MRRVFSANADIMGCLSGAIQASKREQKWPFNSSYVRDKYDTISPGTGQALLTVPQSYESNLEGGRVALQISSLELEAQKHL